MVLSMRPEYTVFFFDINADTASCLRGIFQFHAIDGGCYNAVDSSSSLRHLGAVIVDFRNET